MIRTVQTTVIYCFETRDEKASMSIVVFKHRQRLCHCMGPGQLLVLQMKTQILFTAGTMNIMNKWRKHQMKIIDS